MTTDVKCNPDLYSVIPIDNPVIVPGDRFGEFYYWDSYWIQKGLLISEMTATVKGMLQNIILLLKLYGHVPNGGRSYFVGRSQPPLFIPMVLDYVEKTNDWQFIEDNIVSLETELNFWMKNQTVMVNGHRLATYGSADIGPRPESYKEDTAATANMTASQKQSYFMEIKAAAQSGQDFSSRWFIPISGTIADLKVRSIVPVDLNAILFRNAELLSGFYIKLGQATKAKQYQILAKELKEAITAVFWDEEVGVWLDWDMENKKRRNHFAASNLVPLWAHAYDQHNNVKISAKVINYIEKQNVMQYPGGVPVTKLESGQQWDFPNVWAPMMVSSQSWNVLFFVYFFISSSFYCRWTGKFANIRSQKVSV